MEDPSAASPRYRVAGRADFACVVRNRDDVRSPQQILLSQLFDVFATKGQEQFRPQSLPRAPIRRVTGVPADAIHLPSQPYRRRLSARPQTMYLDIFLIVVMLISGMLAMVRGLIREVL